MLTYVKSLLQGSSTRDKFVRFLLGLTLMAAGVYIIPPISGFAYRHFGQWREILAASNLIEPIAALVAIGIAMNAKPLGHLPYRWGLYTGLWMGLSSIGLLFDTAQGLAVGAMNLVIVTGMSLVIVTATVASVGLILRRRWGVIALMAMYLLAVVWVLRPDFLPVPFSAPPLSRSVGDGEETLVERLIVLPFFLVFGGINGVYFRNRWKLMDAAGVQGGYKPVRQL